MNDFKSSNLKDTLKAIDLSIAKFRADVERGEKLERLMKNPDFQDVILEGYFNVEAIKLFKVLTDPSGASPDSPELIQKKLDGISHFKGYVGTKDYPGTIKTDADRAPDLIIKETQYRKEVTAEYAKDGE